MKERELGYMQIMKLIKEYNFNPSELNHYSLEILNAWRRTMLFIPYDVYRAVVEIKMTLDTILLAIKSRDINNRNGNCKSAVNNQALLDCSSNNRSNPLRKVDIDFMMERAEHMIKASTWETHDGKVCLGEKKVLIEKSEAIRRNTEMSEIKSILKGSKYYKSYYMDNYTDYVLSYDMAKAAVKNIKFSISGTTNLMNTEMPDSEKTKRLRTIYRKKRQREALERLVALIETCKEYDEKRFNRTA